MRCINTPKTPPLRRRCTVARKHQASKDALRLFLAVAFLFNVFIVVRKHRVPKGALRLVLTVDILQDIDVESESTERQKVHYDSLLGTFTEYHASCQKTPSAKRCIKTSYSPVLPVHVPGSQKAPSAKRCIKTLQFTERLLEEGRQKAPSAQNFARNSPSDHNRQTPETAEYQQPDFKH